MSCVAIVTVYSGWKKFRSGGVKFGARGAAGG